MSIPEFDKNGELPPGEHIATLEQINNRFGTSNPRREALISGLKTAIENFKLAGIKRIWIDGSFVTSKFEPNDIDGCWRYDEKVNLDILDPVFLQKSRFPMKAKYGLEFFPAAFTEGDSGLPFPRFFQLNREGDSKGILVVNLGENKP
ncbi:hypothetical protein GCL60_02670 [Silvanigrella paludirubra]|uniref:Uncharacterized protein n=1 Tax=Silvanigrella paludirubra TaxID=2499159 RepID=A0A6N6VXS6_9BACT|nr:hypothetical protein [Silvanigrella paludirubra]KAB8040849.1 hypothetical protein GCL60_02670 [Silvanigrella paludirubra]